jgi:hypothetical protein
MMLSLRHTIVRLIYLSSLPVTIYGFEAGLIVTWQSVCYNKRFKDCRSLAARNTKSKAAPVTVIEQNLQGTTQPTMLKD